MSCLGQVWGEPMSTSRIHCTCIECTKNKMVHIATWLSGSSYAAYICRDTGVRVWFIISFVQKYQNTACTLSLDYTV